MNSNASTVNSNAVEKVKELDSVRNKSHRPHLDYSWFPSSNRGDSPWHVICMLRRTWTEHVSGHSMLHLIRILGTSLAQHRRFMAPEGSPVAGRICIGIACGESESKCQLNNCGHAATLKRSRSQVQWFLVGH